MLRVLPFLLLLFPALLVADDAPPAASADKFAAQKERLAKLQSLVGQWRGVGQPQPRDHTTSKPSRSPRAERSRPATRPAPSKLFSR